MKIKLITLAVVLLVGRSISQVSTPFNFGGFTDYVGWNALQGFPLRVEHKGNQNINFITGFGAFAAQRMTIRGLTGPTQGFVGIGTNFSTPQNLLHIHDGANSYLQVTNGSTGSGGGNGAKFGLFGNTPNAIIASQELNGNMYFATAGSGFPQIKMTILPNGNVGIGSGPPFIIGGITEKLDVDQGDIDVNTPQRSYMIGDQSVLWHKGSNENIFVGVGAGQTHGLNLASRNT